MSGSNEPPIAPEADRIVSVNARGGGSGQILGKMVFVIALLVVIGVGGLMIYGQVSKTNKAKLKAQAEAARSENKPAGIAQRRTFASEDSDGQSDDGRAHPGFTTYNRTCADGTAPIEVGRHESAAAMADGSALYTCNDGNLFVPALEPTVAPPLPGSNRDAHVTPSTVSYNSSSSGTHGVNAGQQTGPARADRYQGDVILSGGGRADVTRKSAEPAPAGDPLMMLALSQIMAGNQTVSKMPADPTKSARTETHPPGSLGEHLTASNLGKVDATLLGDRNMIIPKGKTIDCGLSMKLVSEMAGMASCVLTQNVYSDNGRIILLERGSEAVGEYRASMEQGQRRLFVIWTRIKTPTGVVISLNSPGADALGTTGLNGEVENHWWQRIGSAFLLSTVQDVIAYSAASRSEGVSGGLVLQNMQATGNRMAERVLESTINIRPTLYKRQGDRGTIYVARDLDFGSVYDLRAR